MENDQGKLTANKHWEYVKSVLVHHHIDDKAIEDAGFHYNSAFIHGYKHGYNDALTDRLE